MTAPEPVKHLRNLDSIYSELAAALKRAVAAAPALPAAQTAAHAIVADARDLVVRGLDEVDPRGLGEIAGRARDEHPEAHSTRAGLARRVRFARDPANDEDWSVR